MKPWQITLWLAFSAIYELIEWLVAVATGESAEAFLGTQGYGLGHSDRYGSGPGRRRPGVAHACLGT